MNIGILASGNLGLHVIKKCGKMITPCFIATDTNSVNIINYAKKKKIPVYIGNPRNGQLSNFVNDNNLDIIFSLNYLFIIEEDLIKKAKYCINFHGSLLPKYRGRTPHVWAIINNEKVTGVTAHLIDNGCDTGQIILQKVIKIDDNDTGAHVLAKYNNIYPKIVSEVYNLIVNNKLTYRNQENHLATYFGKRTPDDGLIRWGWQKERIKNWVRAQSFPYPGAYTLIHNERVIIDEIKFSNEGYNYNMIDGSIISDNPLLVKTPNGVVELTKVRTNKSLCKKGEIFHEN